MAGSAKSALVLQGGGALSAYELGAARALYKDPNFSPDLIAGVPLPPVAFARSIRGRGSCRAGAPRSVGSTARRPVQPPQATASGRADA
jgi:hypothetical protein